MARILTKLRIDEISSVDKGAGEGVRIVLMKRDGGTTHVQRLRDIFAKANTLTFDGDSGLNNAPRSAGHTAAPPVVNDRNDVSVLDPKIEAMVATVMALPGKQYFIGGQLVTEPSMTRPDALHYITQTAHGRKFAEHHAAITKADSGANITKKESPMYRDNHGLPVSDQSFGMAKGERFKVADRLDQPMAKSSSATILEVILKTGTTVIENGSRLTSDEFIKMISERERETEEQALDRYKADPKNAWRIDEIRRSLSKGDDNRDMHGLPKSPGIFGAHHVSKQDTEIDWNSAINKEAQLSRNE